MPENLTIPENRLLKEGKQMIANFFSETGAVNSSALTGKIKPDDACFALGLQKISAKDRRLPGDDSDYDFAALLKQAADLQMNEKQEVKPDVNLSECKYFSLAGDDGIVTYKGVGFICDKERNRLVLGDASNMGNCIRVGLSGGGSLVVNRNNFGDLLVALSMFSLEDQQRILTAIEMDRMARANYNKNLQEQTDAILDIASSEKEPVKDQIAEIEKQNEAELLMTKAGAPVAQ